MYVGEMNELKLVMGIAVKWEHSNKSWKWKRKYEQQGKEFAVIFVLKLY